MAASLNGCPLIKYMYLSPAADVPYERATVGRPRLKVKDLSNLEKLPDVVVSNIRSGGVSAASISPSLLQTCVRNVSRKCQ